MMPLSSNSVRRASALTLAALSLACSDATAPLAISPEQLEVIGLTMATELESGALQLTAQDAMGTVDAPQLSIRRPTPGNLGGVALNLQSAGRYPSSQVVDPECGVFSQNPPTDTDADQVPDNLSITFAVPACRLVGQDGSFELTGVIRVTDPLPGTAAAAFGRRPWRRRRVRRSPRASRCPMAFTRQTGRSSTDRAAGLPSSRSRPSSPSSTAPSAPPESRLGLRGRRSRQASSAWPSATMATWASPR